MVVCFPWDLNHKFVTILELYGVRFATTGHFGGKPFWFLWQAFWVSPVQQRMFVPLFPPDKLLIVVHFENSFWRICHTTSPYIVNASEMILSR
jgi:hypothetical protein